MRRWTVPLIVILALVLMGDGWWYGSPWWTLRQMRDAARNHDAATLSGYVDYPALRADLKDEIRRYVARQSVVLVDMDDRGPFAAMADAVVGAAVNAMVTPDNVAAMFGAQKGIASNGVAGQALAPPLPVGVADTAVIDRDGFDTFRVHGKDASKGGLVFHRSGLGWKLVGVDLPTGGQRS